MKPISQILAKGEKLIAQADTKCTNCSEKIEIFNSFYFHSMHIRLCEKCNPKEIKNE